MGEALVKLWERYPTITPKNASPSAVVTKTVVKKSHPQLDPQQQHQELEISGDRQQSKSLSIEFGQKMALDDKGEGKDKDSAHSSDGQSLTATFTTNSSVVPDLGDAGNREGGLGHGWLANENSSFAQNKQFGQQYSRSRVGSNSNAGSFSTPTCSSSMVGPAGGFGMYSTAQGQGAGLHHQVAPGFNPMYTVGPMGAASSLVSSTSPHATHSSVMILQRGSSTPQPQPHAGMLAQAFGGQAGHSGHDQVGHMN